MLDQRELEQIANYMEARSQVGKMSPSGGGTSKRIRRQVRNLLKDVRELDLGWTSPTKYGGGTSVGNNYSALRQSVNEIRNRGYGVLALPIGTLATQSPDPLVIDVPTTILSFGGGIDMAGSTSGLFDVRAPVSVYALDVTNIPAGFAAFDFTNSPTEIQRFSMEGGEYSGAGGYAMFMGNSGNGMRRVGVSDVWMHDLQFGIYLWNQFIEDVYVEESFIEDMAENGVWLGRDFDPDWNNQGNYNVSGCTFKRIGDGSVQPDPDRHAIIAFGRRSVITDNIIDGVDNDTHGDCEAIYLKVRESTISDNTIHNGGRNQGMIAQKGDSRSAEEEGFNTTISGNILRNDEGRVDGAGISVGVGEAIIEENIIDGCTAQPIIVGIDEIVDVKVRGNRVINTGTVANPVSGNISAISIDAQNADVEVSENIVRGVHATGNATALTLSVSTSDPIESARVYGNTFRRIKGGAASTVAGILNNISLTKDIKRWMVARNLIVDVGESADDTGYAILIQDASPRYDSAVIEDNEFVDIGRVLAGNAPAIGGLGGALTNQVFVRRNIGFVTENTGADQFDVGTSSKVIQHGIERDGGATTPPRLARRIRITWGGDPAVDRWWISNVTPTTFTFNTDVNTTQLFLWEVSPHT